MGNISRTLVSENFRGLVLKSLVENDFDIEKTVTFFSASGDDEVKEKVKNKIQLFIKILKLI